MSGAMFLMLKKSKDRRQKEALEAAFKKADVNGDGKLSVEEYSRILKEHGIDCSEEEIRHIVGMADKDHDGFISKEEFLGEPPRKDSPKVMAETAFKVFDKNHDGFVTKQEMMDTSKKLTKAQVDAVFARNDEDHDGKLNLEEFEEFMDHKPKDPEARRGSKTPDEHPHKEHPHIKFNV